MDTKQALSTGQAVKRLGISVGTLSRWEAVGRRRPMTRPPSGRRRALVVRHSPGCGAGLAGGGGHRRVGRGPRPAGAGVGASAALPAPTGSRVESADASQARLLATGQGAGTCEAPCRLPSDPGGREPSCLEQSSLSACSLSGEVSGWARVPEPLAVRALWLDGRGRRRAGPSSPVEVGADAGDLPGGDQWACFGGEGRRL